MIRFMGPLGPISLSLSGLMLVFSPLIRGGNRSSALIVLELLGIVLISLALFQHFIRAGNHLQDDSVKLPKLAWLLITSPIVLGLIYLWPIPYSAWLDLPGRAIYAETMEAAAVGPHTHYPISISPDATRFSLFASIPIVALFFFGLTSSSKDILRLLKLMIYIGLFQAVLGLSQMVAGSHSFLYFNLPSGDAIGTFASRNNYANYLAMSLPLSIYFCAQHAIGIQARNQSHQQQIKAKFHLVLWISIPIILIFALFASSSRAGLITGMLASALSLIAVYIAMHSNRGVGFLIGMGILLVGCGILFTGLDSVMTRFSSETIKNDSQFRDLLARSSFEAAKAFWPVGSGPGTYESAYARFQPPEINGYAEYAHNDYVQLMLEGGVIAVLLIFVALFLYASQLLTLLRSWSGTDGSINQPMLVSLLCGFSILAFLIHSFVDFHMRIPANAMLAAFLVGVFLRMHENRLDIKFSKGELVNSHKNASIRK